MVLLESTTLGLQHIWESRKFSSIRSSTFQVLLEWLHIREQFYYNYSIYISEGSLTPLPIAQDFTHKSPESLGSTTSGDNGNKHASCARLRRRFTHIVKGHTIWPNGHSLSKVLWDILPCATIELHKISIQSESYVCTACATNQQKVKIIQNQELSRLCKYLGLWLASKF